ncbi:hypothetical protein CDIK_4351 [Cucumispora dikerogammari]|nr:hypothetical protein CDIK_4351 [Cucumispora dikerogammari]
MFIDEVELKISMRKARVKSKVRRRAVSVIQTIRIKNISACAGTMKTSVFHYKIELTAQKKNILFSLKLTIILNASGKHDAVFVIDNLLFNKSAEIKAFIETSSHELLYLSILSVFKSD